MTTSEDGSNSKAGVTSLRHSSRAKKPSRRAEEMHLAEKVGEKLDFKKTKKGDASGSKSSVKSSKKKRKDIPVKDEDNGGEYEQDEEAAAAAASEDENEDEDEEDDDKEVAKKDKNDEIEEDGTETEVFCLCRKGDDGRPMVFCAECNDWFHFKCVNLSKKRAEMLSEYICPTCSEKTGKRSKNIDDEEGSEASASPFQDNSEGSASPPRRPGGPMKRKSMEEDGMRKRNRGHSPQAATRKTSISASQGSTRAVESSRKTSLSGPAPTGSIAVMKARSETLRKHAVDQLKGTFEGIFIEVIHNESERRERVENYAVEFEETLFEAHNETIPKTSIKTASKVYRDRLRSYLFNLKDKSNSSLRQKIASGELAANDLATMSNDELANDEIRKEVERRKRENLEQSILKKEKAPLRKLTHKGEIDIEYEATQNSRVAEELKDQVDKESNVPKMEKKIELTTMSPPAVPRLSAVQGSPTSATNPRRISTPLQSPSMSFDFDNVWAGADTSQEDKETEDEKGEEVLEDQDAEKLDAKDGIVEEAAGEERADNLIDDFLGMGEEANTDLHQTDAEKSDEDIKWRGAISMPEEGRCTGKVRQVAGRRLNDTEWSALFPFSHNVIQGRLPSAVATPYLEQSRLTSRTELVVMTMHHSWESESIKEAPPGGPTTEAENEAAFAKLLSYFVVKGRYGVLLPHPSAKGQLVKDFYIAPLTKESILPAWLDSCMNENLLEGAELRRDNDIFVIVAVLFRQFPRQQSDTPAYSPPQHITANIQVGSGTPPTSNLNALLGAGGSNTLQDLLKAVGGNKNTPLTGISVQNSGIEQQDLTLPSQHPSIEALSEMPKPQLEDMLQKNPTLVDELLKTLVGSKSASPRPPGPPPCPPPPPPPGVYGNNQPSAQFTQYVNNPYVNNYQQQQQQHQMHMHMQRPSSTAAYPQYGDNRGNAGITSSRPMQSNSMPGGVDQGWHQNPNYYGRPSAGYASPPGGYGPPMRGGDQRGPTAFHQGAGRRN